MKFILSCLVLVALSSFAQDDTNTTPPQKPASQPAAKGDALCAEANTQMEINQCFGAAYEKADTELNQLYSDLLKKQKPANQDHLREAQRAWMKYRDANCEAAAAIYQGGTIAPSVRMACLERDTRNRIDELHHIYASDK